MKPVTLWLLFTFMAFTFSSAIPKPEGKDRVHNQKLSDAEHFSDDEHNPDYDHDAFLGEEAKTFDDLSPEESKERLKLIYDKIDKDADGLVTEDELTKWIKHVQSRYVKDDTDRQWKEMEPEGDVLKWEVYLGRTYGTDHAEGTDGGENFVDLKRRDEKRWGLADQNGDKHLSKDEYMNFLHPEEAEHMKSVVVDETLEDIDKDKDGFISLEEYVGDMWPSQSEGPEPDWVKSEREQFSNYRDFDKDGKMNKKEIEQWILPDDYDQANAESMHLIEQSDNDQDGKLTKEEVLEKYDIFVGSQATDFGEALARHDEF